MNSIYSFMQECNCPKSVLEGSLKIEKSVLGIAISDLSYINNFKKYEFLNRNTAGVYLLLKKANESGKETFLESDWNNAIENQEFVLDKICWNDILEWQESAKDLNPDEVKEMFKQQFAGIESIRSTYRTKMFLEELDAISKIKPISTGFNHFDQLLGGGFREGLYVLGAMSSLGKTTFALQIASKIAASKKPVLFFSLEQSEIELKCKVLSRLLFENEKQIVTALEIPNYLKDKPNDKSLIHYFTHEDRYLNIIFDYQRPSLNKIENTILSFIELYGESPVVFIDYLQIIEFSDRKATDKQNIDEAVSKLKAMSIKFHTPVFVISSINRGSYGEAVSLSAFKESGGIEYGCDVVLGLNFYSKKGKIDIEKAKGEETRLVELSILKNRSGPTGTKDYLIFGPNVNTFKEVSEEKIGELFELQNQGSSGVS